MTTYNDRFSATQIQTSEANYSALGTVLVPLIANVQMFWPSQQLDATAPGTATMNRLMNVYATVANIRIILPPSDIVSVGQEAWFFNIGPQPVDIYLNDGVTLLVVIPAGTNRYMFLDDNSTTNGAYTVAISPGGPAVTSVGIQVPDATDMANIILNPVFGGPGNPITGAGVIQFSTGADLQAIINIGTTGLVQRTGAAAWSTITILGTPQQVSVTNNPANITIGLTPSVVIAGTLTAGNLTVGVNGFEISSTTNQIGIVQPNALAFYQGANYVSIQAPPALGQPSQWILPTTFPALGQVLGVFALPGAPVVELGWQNAPTVTGVSVDNTIPFYTNAAGALGDTDLQTSVAPNSFLGIKNAGVGNAQLQFINNATNDYTSLSGTAVVGNVNFTLPPNVGTAPNELMVTDGAGALSFVPLTGIPATKAQQQAAALTTVPVVPMVQQFHPSASKVSVFFSNAPVISPGAYNVASVVGGGVGIFTITFTNPFADINYVVSITLSTGGVAITGLCGAKSVNNVIINTVDNTGALAAISFASVVIYGTLA